MIENFNSADKTEAHEEAEEATNLERIKSFMVIVIRILSKFGSIEFFFGDYQELFLKILKPN